MVSMSGAYPIATLLKAATLGLVVLGAVILLLAGTVIGRERRRRFIMSCFGIYALSWTAVFLYNTWLLLRYFLKIKPH